MRIHIDSAKSRKNKFKRKDENELLFTQIKQQAVAQLTKKRLGKQQLINITEYNPTYKLIVNTIYRAENEKQRQTHCSHIHVNSSH